MKFASFGILGWIFLEDGLEVRVLSSVLGAGSGGE